MKKRRAFSALGEITMYEKQLINFEQAIQSIKDQFQFDFVALALVQPAQFRFVLKWEYVLGNQSDRHRRIVLQTGKGVAGTVFKTGKSLCITNVDAEIGRADMFNYPIVVAENLTSFGAIPLYKSGRVKGVLLGAFREDEAIMTPELFEQFEAAVGKLFCPYYNQEMVNEI